MKLAKEFFNCHTTIVARRLLGKFLVRKRGKRIVRAMITETEAYHGPDDRASHASRGRTLRTAVMFGSPGTTYVYLIYGMYYCLNFVTMREGFPAAVLIRGVKSEKLKVKSDGPGRLCRALKIDRKLNNLPLGNRHIWIEDQGIRAHARNVVTSKRIGVDYAGMWKHKKWRFTMK